MKKIIISILCCIIVVGTLFAQNTYDRVKVTLVFNNAEIIDYLGTEQYARTGYLVFPDDAATGTPVGTSDASYEYWFYAYPNKGYDNNMVEFSINIDLEGYPTSFRLGDGSKGVYNALGTIVDEDTYEIAYEHNLYISENSEAAIYLKENDLIPAENDVQDMIFFTSAEFGYTHDTIVSVYFLMDNDVVVLSNNYADSLGYVDGWNSSHIEKQNGSVYEKGEKVKITAHPRNDSYEFVQWSNGVKTPTLEFTADRDTIVLAEFRKKANLYTITFDPANGDEPVVVKDVEANTTPVYPDGTPAKEPDERFFYTFDEWYMGDTRGIQPTTCDTTYTAHYTAEPILYTLTLNTEAAEGEIVVVSYKEEGDDAVEQTTAPATLEFPYNTTVTLRAEPKDGYRFLAWDDLTGDEAATATRTITITEDTELTALFMQQFSIVVNYDAAKGEVTGAGVYDKDATVILTATPAYGYILKSWSDTDELGEPQYGDEDAAGNKPVVAYQRTLTATADLTIDVTFEQQLPSGLSDLEGTAPQVQKILRDGQVLILRDGKTFTTLGTEVK